MAATMVMPQSDKPKLAALMVRESTAEQMDHYGPKIQRRRALEYCEDHEYRLSEAHVYTDGGVSGRYERGRSLKALTEAGERGEFQIVLVGHTSRWARNVEISQHYKRRLRKVGIKVISLTQQYDPDTVEGGLTKGLYELLDEHYIDALSVAVADGQKERYYDGKHVGRIPIGYMRDLTNSCSRVERGQTVFDWKLIPDPHLAPMVIEGFRRYATGQYSFLDLARWANAAGYKNRNGESFTRWSWQVILKNVSYTGYIGFKRKSEPNKYELVRAQFEPLVDLALFKEVQERLKGRTTCHGRPAQHRTYILRGIARCADCSRTLTGEARSGGRRLYYRDPGARDSDCQGWLVPAEPVEQQLATGLKRLRLSSEAVARVLAVLRRRWAQNDVEVLRRNVEQAMVRTRQMFKWGDLDEVTYKAEMRDLERQLNRLPQQQDERRLKEAAANAGA